MDDNESIDKSSLYHEPFNVNMYTSAASGCSLNDLQRNHVTPDYTGKYYGKCLLKIICAKCGCSRNIVYSCSFVQKFILSYYFL